MSRAFRQTRTHARQFVGSSAPRVQIFMTASGVHTKSRVFLERGRVPAPLPSWEPLSFARERWFQQRQAFRSRSRCPRVGAVQYRDGRHNPDETEIQESATHNGLPENGRSIVDPKSSSYKPKPCPKNAVSKSGYLATGSPVGEQRVSSLSQSAQSSV